MSFRFLLSRVLPAFALAAIAGASQANAVIGDFLINGGAASACGGTATSTLSLVRLK